MKLIELVNKLETEQPWIILRYYSAGLDHYLNPTAFKNYEEPYGQRDGKVNPEYVIDWNKTVNFREDTAYNKYWGVEFTISRERWSYRNQIKWPKVAWYIEKLPVNSSLIIEVDGARPYPESSEELMRANLTIESWEDVGRMFKEKIGTLKQKLKDTERARDDALSTASAYETRIQTLQMWVHDMGGDLKFIVDPREALKTSLRELVAAMHKYENDADGDQPQAHRDMMARANKALGTEVKA